MMRLILLNITVFFLVNCGDISTQTTLLSTAIIDQGFTCPIMKQVNALSEDERAALRMSLINKVGIDKALYLADNHETCEFDILDPSQNGEVGTKQSAIRGRWAHESIERGDFGHSGEQAIDIYLDTREANICGFTGIADYIIHHHVSGAFNNKSRLRGSPQNLLSWCYFKNPSDARVYEDDDILTCAGYWRVTLCGALIPLSADIKMWIDG